MSTVEIKVRIEIPNHGVEMLENLVKNTRIQRMKDLVEDAYSIRSQRMKDLIVDACNSMILVSDSFDAIESIIRDAETAVKSSFPNKEHR